MAEELKNPVQGPPEALAGEAQPALDEAGTSLANALQTSFRVLTFLIVVLLALFVAQGFFTVQTDEKAIILRFGRTDLSLVKDQGLHYALPYPIDEVVRVWVKPRKVEVNTFWSKVTEEAKTQAAERGGRQAVVVGGAEDAFMLTGDMNILQARWDVTYRLRRENQSVINYFVKIGNEENEQRLIRTAVQSAVIRQLGRMKVFDAYPSGTTALPETMKGAIEEMLLQLDCGLAVEQINLIEIRPPKDVKGAFDEVLAFQQVAVEQRLLAERDRQKTLIDAAGEVGIKLGDEIQKWWAAKNEGRNEDLKKIEEEIHRLFDLAGGAARTTLAEANAYRTSVVEGAKGDAAQLASLMGNSPREVAIFLDHARVDALMEVFNNSYENYLYRPGLDKARPGLELWINRRPELLREMKKVEETR